VSAPVDLVPSIHAIAKTAVTDVTSTCLTLIGRAQRELVAQFGLSRPKWTYRPWDLVTVSGTKDYDLATLIPADVTGLTMEQQFLISIHATYQSVPLEHDELARLLELDPKGTLTNSKPQRWAWTGITSAQEIRLQPTPDAVYTLALELFRAITYVTSADTGAGVVLDWPETHEEILIQHAAMMARKDARRIIDGKTAQEHQVAIANFIVDQRWTPPRGHRHIRPRGPARRYRRFTVDAS